MEELLRRLRGVTCRTGTEGVPHIVVSPKSLRATPSWRPRLADGSCSVVSRGRRRVQRVRGLARWGLVEPRHDRAPITNPTWTTSVEADRPGRPEFQAERLVTR